MEGELVELSMYRNAIRLLLESRSPRIIQNDTVSFAKIIVEEFIRSANEAVYIYSTRLDEAAWGAPGVLAAIGVEKEKGVEFHVLTREPLADDTLHSQKLREIFPRMSSVERANQVDDDFLVVDGVAFRLEPGGVYKQGVACAYSPVNAQALISVFLKLQGDSSK